MGLGLGVGLGVGVGVGLGLGDMPHLDVRVDGLDEVRDDLGRA